MRFVRQHEPIKVRIRRGRSGSYKQPATMGFLAPILLFSWCGATVSAQEANTYARFNQAEPVSSQQTMSGDTAPPVTITLLDAIARARKYYAQYLATQSDSKIAHEDVVQARAALLPSLGYTQQYLGTQGNGTIPTGRYVTNDGVHVYRAWAVLHQDMPAGYFTRSSLHRASAGETLAEARAEIGRRGLTVTTTRSYYGFIVAHRKYAIAQELVNHAEQFLKTTELLEKGREVAYSDVVKAQLQLDQQKLAFQEAQLGMENARLALAVLLSPTLNENFTAVDDTDNTPVLPPLPEVSALAQRENQDVRGAIAALKQAKADSTIARAGFFPTLTFDADYGIEANAFALRSTVAANPQAGKLPNLGYFVTGSLNVPVWNWGATRSKLHQAEYRQSQVYRLLSLDCKPPPIYKGHYDPRILLKAFLALHDRT